MKGKRLLIVTQDLAPYLDINDACEYVRKTAQHFQSKGMDIRILMPRFGNINERRNRLHEVVRLSGINIVVKDEDYPLIMKVAALPGTRLQVYFLDNEDFFKRKGVFTDDKNKPYKDNAERMAFFCKGSAEIIKKFGWAPDIIHCHGWMTSLFPMYIKTAYQEEPVFKDSKVIYSVYENDEKITISKDLDKIININDNVPAANIEEYTPNLDGLDAAAIKYTDAVIKGTNKLDKSVKDAIKNNKKISKTLLEHKGENFIEDYEALYKSLME